MGMEENRQTEAVIWNASKGMSVQDMRNPARKTEKKVFSYMERHRMIVPGDKIIAGVSGGADSVCLLFLLLEYCRRVPVSLCAVHVNHCIRADSGQDAQFVESLCRELGVPFYLAREDVRGLAAREKLSEEDAGRIARYRAFRRAAEEMGGTKIAVAHNMGDNAETMLFHLFRGSGLKGLCGIAPVRGNVIHPLLCLERREVEAYLAERGISWRTDSTNGEDHYRRNRIRHHILPYAESEIAQGAAVRMCRTAELLSETEDYLERQTREAWGRCVRAVGQADARQERLAGCGAASTMLEQPAGCGAVSAVQEQPAGCGDASTMQEQPAGCGDASTMLERAAGHGEAGIGQQPYYIVDVSRFRELHIVLRRRIVLGIAKALSPTGKDISAVHVEDVLSLFEELGNRDVSLPFGICARRRYNGVILERRSRGDALGSRSQISRGDAPGAGSQLSRGDALGPGSQLSRGDAPGPGSQISREGAPSGEQNPQNLQGVSRQEAELPARAEDFPVTVRLENGEILEFTIIFGIKRQEILRNQYTKWLDYDKIVEVPVVRYRKPGDYLTIADGEGKLRHKPLKEYMITEKIPREQRGQIPVLASGSHILWLAGYRISEYFKVGENTNHVLQVKLMKGETEEENVGAH